MIKSDFASVFSAEAIAAFQCQFHFGIEVGLPHVRTDEADARAELGAENLEEEIEGLLGAVLSDPQEALAVVVDLIDQRPELVFLAHMDLIDAKSNDPGEVAILDAVVDRRVRIGFSGRLDSLFAR